MNKYFNKKIIFALVILSMVLPFFALPNKAFALFGVGDVVVDPTNLVQTTATAVNTTSSAFATLSLNLKEYVLDGLGMLIVKQIIRQITNSVVNWINSGFEGSPAFLQNPGSFFLDVADQITGDFISKHGGPLQELCSPFSIDIRIALAFKYRPRIQERFACTITTVIKNSKNAVTGATLNGFTAGDFKQGGWPAFVSLTTEPTNNPYGAYLEAESELSWRVASAKAEQKDEISAGRGFLSWKDQKCVAEVNKHNKAIKEQRASGASQTEGSVKFAALKSKNECPVNTPGSVIQESLQNNLNGPLRELEIADEINEIVNALFAQLVTQVLQKGLSGVSSKDASGSSYLDSTINDINTEANPQVQSIKAELTKNLGTYKKNAEEYRKYRNEALTLMLSVKNTYDSAIKCYNDKINSNPLTIRPGNVPVARARVTEIESVIASRVSTKALDLLAQAQKADEMLKTLQDIENKANAAKTLNELNEPSQKYSLLLSSSNLITPIDIEKAKADLEVVRVDHAELIIDSNRKVQACDALN